MQHHILSHTSAFGGNPATRHTRILLITKNLPPPKKKLSKSVIIALKVSG